MCWLLAVLAGLAFSPTLAFAQSVVYHLHNEASATGAFKQLKTAGPDVAQAVVQTAALQGVAVGEKKIIEFDTAAGLPNTPGKIPSGATVSAVVWMRKTAALGTMFPRVKVRLNTSTGTSLCTATGTTALTTTLTAYTLSCTTTANITMVAADRLYVWTGVNLTVGSSAGAFRGELGIEGTLNGSADSRVDIPTALPAPAITTLTPNVGPIGQSVTIAGTNFRAQQLTSAVKFFNNRTATVTSWSNTTIVVTVPTSSATGAVTVTVAGTASAGVTFTVGAVPTIAQLAPNAGLPGTSVTITGSSFGATKGSSTVKFNGVTAATTSWSASSIAATVPAGSTTGNVVVTVGGIGSSGVLFTVPTLNSISVTPGVAIVPIGGQQQYSAWGYYSDSVTRNVTASAAWASTDGAVATIAGAGLATVTGTAGATTISATIGAVSGATDLTAAPSKFKPVGSLNTARRYHRATLLLDGRVLITGGQDNTNKIINSAEIYDPATGRFTPTGNMQRKRHEHTATLLQDGTVLITGGHSYFPDEYHRTAEIYDPVTGMFSLTTSMSAHRSFHTATLLADGRVLVDHGYTNQVFGPQPAAVYDPVTATFALSGTPAVRRTAHAVTSLNSGLVLATGGFELADAEVYDPTTGLYSPAPPLSVGRYSHAATLLSDGRVLVAGGGDTCAAKCSADLYDSTLATVTSAGAMSVGRTAHTATRLDDGRVLVVGGAGSALDGGATAELFDPSDNTFVAGGAMAVARSNHTATLLQDGSVLIVGGSGWYGAELYVTNAVAPLSLMVTPSTATLQTGTSRAFTAIDHLGHPRTDAAWSVTDANIATVDPDTGIVIAVASGSVTLTATIGAVSGVAQIAVTTGPPPTGTLLWTVTAPAGTTSRQLIPAAGAGRGGPSLLAVSTTATETEVQGLTPDGQQQWRVWLPGAARQVVPNASGGVLVTMFNGCDGGNPLQLTNIDGPTGMLAWQAVAAAVCNRDLPQIAIRHDGAVAVATPGNIAGFPNLMMLDGDTGAALSVPTIPQSTFTSVGGQQTPGYSRIGPTMVDVDGTVHLLYEKRFLSYPPQVVDTGIWLMSVRADQTYTTTQLNTTTQNTNLFPGRIIPDGQGGLLASWIDSPIVPAGQPPAQSTFRAVRIVSGGGGLIPFDLPLTPPLDLLYPADSPLPTNPELVLGENDRTFVSYGNMVGGFLASSGEAGWNYTSANDITMLAAAADASLVAKTPAGDGTDTILRFPVVGELQTSTLGLANIGHVVKDVWSTSAITGSLGPVQGETVDWATTGWFQASPGGQRRVKGVYKSMQTAAFEMMNALRQLATNYEWGGLICQNGPEFHWSEFVTSDDPGFVDVLGQTSCLTTTPVADVHAHLLTEAGLVNPSSYDLGNANARPDLTFYLSAPRLDRSPGSQFIRYKGPDAAANTCYWFNEWKKYSSAAGWVSCTPQ